MPLSSSQTMWLKRFAEAVVLCDNELRRCDSLSFQLVRVAQAALETAWGSALIGWNCFGIKDTDRYPGCVYVKTKEYEDGTYKTKQLAFEAYPTMADCFEDHTKLVTGGFNQGEQNCYFPHFRLYKNGKFQEVEGYVWGMSAHYAGGNPQYPLTILQMISMPVIKEAVLDAVQRLAVGGGGMKA